MIGSKVNLLLADFGACLVGILGGWYAYIDDMWYGGCVIDGTCI